VDSNQRRTLLKASVFFVTWVLLLGGAYWYFLVKPKQWFDAQMQQPPVLADMAQQTALRTLLRQRFPELEDGRSWFVRFKQDDCGCERFVELYHQRFTAEANPAQMQVVAVDLAAGGFGAADRRLLAQWIPATPSVVLFNPRGQIQYFGPYHQDGICNAENSYLEPVLQALRSGQELTVLNTLVFGCFCSTTR
jgi:hypothetical protein|tara:strand:- start:9327 stop:9905 length:579 start_codon:yes stop_codon:yes gene_type:complete